MADVNVPQLPSGFRTVGEMYKPVQPTGLGAMSLGDIVNMATTAQAYQKQAATMPYEIEQKKAESESKQLSTAAQKQQAIGASMIARINNPMIISAEANPNAANRQELADNMRKWGEQQGKDLGLDPDTTARLTQPYIDIALNNPGQLRSYLKERHIAGLDQSARTEVAAINPVLTEIGGQPALFNRATGQVSPINPSGQPQGLPQGVTPEQMGRPANQQQPQAPAMQLPYQPRLAGDVRPMAPAEQADLTQGQAYRSSVAARQPELATARRNVDEVIDAANKIEKEKWFTSGLAGAATRKISTAMGDTTYTQLSKDLANVQIANIKAQGGSLDTVGGQQLIRMANGDETYPPEVLKNIARRTQADITNIDLQAQAAQRFSSKFGDANMNAFKTAWGQNADSKVFEAMNIYNDGKLNSTEKKAMIDKLLGNDPAQRKQFFQKYQNIQKLVNTGSL